MINYHVIAVSNYSANQTVSTPLAAQDHVRTVCFTLLMLKHAIFISIKNFIRHLGNLWCISEQCT